MRAWWLSSRIAGAAPTFAYASHQLVAGRVGSGTVQRC